MSCKTKNNINEWYYPDNFQELPNKITLYHGTDYYGLEEILIDGVIDAKRGKQTGETRGMNWFFTNYKNNFSRGFLFSIDVDKNEINTSSNGFRYMNNNEIATYNPVDISNRNFTIIDAYDFKVEDLEKNLWQKCLNQTENKYDAIFLFVDKLSKFSVLKDYDISINNEIILQILKQIVGEDFLKQECLIENKQSINEVNTNDIRLDSFEPKTKLHPKIWVNDKLNSRVRLRLLDIADDFIDTLAVDWVKPKDVVFTGSLANYNWSRYSDIDIHVIIDYDKVYKKQDFVEDYFNAKKEIWLNEHPKLKIYGYPVEMYVEDIKNDNTSTGIYSLYKNKWIKEPTDFEDVQLNEKYIKQKAAELMTQIDKIEKYQKTTTDEYKIEKYRNKLKNIFDKLKKMRKESLSKHGEMSSGNIIYKILRRTKYIDKIWDLINTSYDKINSINENKPH